MLPLELLKSLIEYGNGAWAQELSKELAPKDVPDFDLAMLARPRPLAKLVAPVAYKRAGDVTVVWVPLELGDSPSPALSEETQTACEEGLDAAWRCVGGHGQRPMRFVRSELLELLVAHGLLPVVRGRSFQLPAFLLGCQAFGYGDGDAAIAFEAASGEFDEVLGERTAKLEAFAALERRWPAARLLVASRERIDGVESVDSPELALQVGFWAPPVLNAPLLHVACGEGRARGLPDDAEILLLPNVIDVEVARKAADEVARHMTSSSVWRLSIGGPVGLWAMLSVRLKNKGPRILFEQDGKLWYSNRTIFPQRGGSTDSGHPIQFTTDKSIQVQTSWAKVEWPSWLTPRDLPALVGEALDYRDRASEKGELEVAIKAKVVVAGAVTTALSRHATKLVLLHFDPYAKQLTRWPLD